jgi:outer membrane protein insertion porin family
VISVQRASLVLIGLLLASDAWARRREPPGPAEPMVHAVDVTGNQAISTEDLLKRVTLKPGEPFKRDQLKFSQGVLESTYRDRGYYDVLVATSVTVVSANQMDVGFSIREGDIYHLGQVRVEGNRIVSDEIIRKNVDVKPGDVFSQSKIFEGNRQLYMTGYFESIDIQYTTSTARTVDMILRVKERATRFAKGSAGYGTQTKERLSFGFEDLNFLGHARKLDVTATLSGFVTHPAYYKTRIIEADLKQPLRLWHVLRSAK